MSKINDYILQQEEQGNIIIDASMEDFEIRALAEQMTRTNLGKELTVFDNMRLAAFKDMNYHRDVDPSLSRRYVTTISRLNNTFRILKDSFQERFNISNTHIGRFHS